MLNWGNRFNICCFLDDHNYHFRDNAFDCILAAGVVASLSTGAGTAFRQLESFHQKHQDWIFGHLSFELKKETEGIESQLPDPMGFPDLYFFVPEYLIRLSGNELLIGSVHNDHNLVLQQLLEATTPPSVASGTHFTIRQRQDTAGYMRTVEKIKQHILRGDCYELNYCQEFYAEGMQIDPLQTFLSLHRQSPTPFAAYYRLDSRYCLCASPERFLRKSGAQLISQPIKGTRKRALHSPEEDERMRQELHSSEKERAENVMVVDLVRNDMSRVCKEGSVSVDELFGLYRFPQVHQMISTVSGELEASRSWVEAIEACFPMGSMTGAPKRRVLELIEQYEKIKRGLYSGSIGYVSPNGDFDFNVVIRSILYNADSKYLSFQAGSAITFQSEAQEEYDECLLKAAFIKDVLEK